jgi:hypothetical protein
MSSLLRTVAALVLDSYVQTVLWVVLFSGLVCLAAVYRHYSVSLTACFNPAVSMYLAMLIFGNSILAVVLAVTGSKIPKLSGQGWWVPFYAAVVGTFGAELLRRQEKIKWLQDRIGKLQEDLRKKAVHRTKIRQVRINALKLAKRRELDLGPSLTELRIKRPDLAARIDAAVNDRNQEAFLLASERADLGDGILPLLARSWGWAWFVAGILLVVGLIYSYAAWGTDLQVRMLRRTEISGHFEHVESRELIMNLVAKSTNARPLVEVAANCPIDSFEATNEPLEAVMNRICTICGCEWMIEAGHPPTLWVTRPISGAQTASPRAAAPTR